MVFSLAYHCLHDRALAEEVAQDVFLELHRNLASLESPAHVRHWLRRVAAHRSIDQARRRRHFPHVAIDQAPEPSSPAREDDPLLAGTLRRLVATLPERARMIVILRFQEDLEPAEIAEVLGVPVRTVKSSLHRALLLLRGKMCRKCGVIRT